MTWDVSAPPWVAKGTYCIGEVDSDIAIAQTFICDEEERNAYLIAAAPELLDALQQAELLLEELDDDEPGFNEKQLKQTLRLAKHAIEKAGGKE